MTRRLNLKFLIGLTAAALLAAVGLYLLYVFQTGRHAAALLASIDRAEERGDGDRLTQYLERYLVLKPGDAGALARYGLLLARQADSPPTRSRALAALDEAVRRSPERDDVRRKRFLLAMDLGQFAKARDDLAVLLKASPENGELEEQSGRCEQALGLGGAPERAAEWFSRAIDHAPARIDAYVRLAGLLRGPLADPDRADAVMDQLVAANDDSAEAHLERARYRQTFRSPEEAAADVAKARALAPDDPDVLVTSARFAAAAGDRDEARRLLQHARQLHPNHGPLYPALAALEQQAGRHAEAVACLQEGLTVVPESGRGELLLALLDVRIQGGESAEAETLLAQLRRGGPSPVLDFHEARLLVQKGEWLSAAALLRRIRPQLVSSPDLGVSLLLLLAECSGRLGDADQELEAYQGAVIADPRSGPAHMGLGSALLARGRAADAAAEFRQAAALRDAPPGAWASLAKALILRNRGAPPSGRNWEEIGQALDRAEAADPAGSAPAILRAEAFVAQGQADPARRTLREARDRFPGQAALWAAAIDLESQDGKSEVADALLREARGKLGDRVELLLARVSLTARRGGAGAARDLAGQERETEQRPAAEQEILLDALGDAYLLAGDAPSAERVWERLAERRPGDLGVRLRLFDLALESGRDDVVRRLLGEIRTIEGEDGVWRRYGEAALRIARATRGEKEDLDQAAKDLAEVAERRPGWSRVLVAEAEICDLQGRPEGALEKYQQAVNLGERRPAVVRRLVDLLYDRQRFVEADRVIRDVQQGASLPEGLDRLGVEAALRAQNPERALALARQAAADRPTDYRSHLWLGLGLWAAGRRAEAESSLRQAVGLADAAPEPRVALVQFLAGTGRPADAEAAVREAEGKLPRDRAALPLAQCWEAIDRPDRAEPYYLAALAANPDSPAVLRAVAWFYLRGGQVGKAEPYLMRLADATGKAPAADVAWARRNLAMARAAGGDYRRFHEALDLLDRNRQLSGGDTIDDRRARAMVLATRPSSRADATEVLEELGRRQLLTAEDQYILAQLYEDRGKWADADRWMERLLAADGDSRLYLSHYARGKLRRKDAAAARPSLERLERLYPESWETAEIQARMLRAEGKSAEAAALLEGFPDRRRWDPNPQPPPGAEGVALLVRVLLPSAGPLNPQPPPCAETTALLDKFLVHRLSGPEETEAFRRAAPLLEELGRPDGAETMYREYVSRSERPDSLLQLATFLGRQKRVGEALDVCERARSTCPPEAVAAVSVALLRAEPANPDHIRRVEAWLEAATQKASETTALLSSLADLRDLEGRYDEAESLYRRVIRNEPDNVRALNNLAWLLAVRGGPPGGAEALDRINHAIDVFGPEAAMLDTRASVYLATGQTDLAEADLRQALAEAPEATQYFHYARALFQGKDLEAAGEALRSARAAGLTADALHPLERPAYDQLLSALGGN